MSRAAEVVMEAANDRADLELMDTLEAFEDDALEALYDATCVTLRMRISHHDYEETQ